MSTKADMPKYVMRELYFLRGGAVYFSGPSLHALQILAIPLLMGKILPPPFGLQKSWSLSVKQFTPILYRVAV